MVVKVPSSVKAVIQRSAKAKPKTVHIDKLKEFLGKPPKKWPVPGFVDEVNSPDDVVVRSDEGRVTRTRLERPKKEDVGSSTKPRLRICRR